MEAFLELVSSSQLGIGPQEALQLLSVGVTQLVLGFEDQPVECGSTSPPLVRSRMPGAPGMYNIPDLGLSALIPPGHQFTIQLSSFWVPPQTAYILKPLYYPSPKVRKSQFITGGNSAGWLYDQPPPGR